VNAVRWAAPLAGALLVACAAAPRETRALEQRLPEAPPLRQVRAPWPTSTARAPAGPGCEEPALPEAAPSCDGTYLVLRGPVDFDPRLAAPPPSRRAALERVRATLERDRALLLLRVEVRALSPGEAARRRAQERADAVLRWLASRGVDAERLDAWGLDAGHPGGAGERADGSFAVTLRIVQRARKAR
jgi:hypothetical protein